MSAPLTLVSHQLCPYVQRAAIVLAEKGIAFEQRPVDLANKPGWFKAISPLGKTPVLLVGETPVFESAVICEYLDETCSPKLHPADPLQRARHRSWMEFSSATLNAIAGFYNAPNEPVLRLRRDELAARFIQLEAVLGDGPFFAGPEFTLVDAVFAPVFRYFDVIDTIADFALFDQTPKTRAWRSALAERPSVHAAVVPEYRQRLREFLQQRGSALSRLMAGGNA